ncbi:hypothetical protein BX616_005232 [Lobosporangium transversale]|nr:hypothetical protein BX616_005232 [Lobosporangium transversale]
MKHYNEMPYQRQRPYSHSVLRTASSAARVGPQIQTSSPHWNHYLSYTAEPAPLSVHQDQRLVLPSYSTQALRTFAPPQMGFSPDAAIVSIRDLQPQKAFVRVSGRIIRISDAKVFADKRDNNKLRWLQTFAIKDEYDTVEVKFWHKTEEHLERNSNIMLDQVVHIFTDDVKLNGSLSYCEQNNGKVTYSSSPLCLNLTEGKVGHRIVLGNEAEMATLFKNALNANVGGVVPSVSIKQAVALSDLGKNEPFHMIVGLKKLTKTQMIVFDVQGQEATLTLWGEAMFAAAQQWTPFITSLILTGPQVGIYASKPQITVGYQTYIQVDPRCKNIEWLKHSASQYSNGMHPSLVNVLDPTSITLDRITSIYHIKDIIQLVNGTGAIEQCPSCKLLPKNDDSWSYSLMRHISLMDDTAELRHPSISSEAVQALLGYKVNYFNFESKE